MKVQAQRLDILVLVVCRDLISMRVDFDEVQQLFGNGFCDSLTPSCPWHMIVDLIGDTFVSFSDESNNVWTYLCCGNSIGTQLMMVRF